MTVLLVASVVCPLYTFILYSYSGYAGNMSAPEVYLMFRVLVLGIPLFWVVVCDSENVLLRHVIFQVTYC